MVTYLNRVVRVGPCSLEAGPTDTLEKCALINLKVARPRRLRKFKETGMDMAEVVRQG